MSHPLQLKRRQLCSHCQCVMRILVKWPSGADIVDRDRQGAPPAPPARFAPSVAACNKKLSRTLACARYDYYRPHAGPGTVWRSHPSRVHIARGRPPLPLPQAAASNSAEVSADTRHLGVRVSDPIGVWRDAALCGLAVPLPCRGAAGGAGQPRYHASYPALHRVDWPPVTHVGRLRRWRECPPNLAVLESVRARREHGICELRHGRVSGG